MLLMTHLMQQSHCMLVDALSQACMCHGLGMRQGWNTHKVCRGREQRLMCWCRRTTMTSQSQGAQESPPPAAVQMALLPPPVRCNSMSLPKDVESLALH